MKMTRTQAREYALSHSADYLQSITSRDKHGGYICPLCQSGSGKKGTGMSSRDKVHYTCWSCGAVSTLMNADIFNITALLYNIDLKAAFDRVYDFFCIDIDEGAPRSAAADDFREEPQEPAPTADYTEFFKICRSELRGAAAYLRQRGISLTTAERCGVGFAPEWKSPASIARGKNPRATPRLIFPTSAGGYGTRDTRDNLNDYEKQFKGMKEGAAGVFNAAALRAPGDAPVFVVEGEIDALSLEEVGGAAIGLGGITHTGALLRLLDQTPTEHPLVIAFDADDKGQQAAAGFCETLRNKAISFLQAPAGIWNGSKDANELLVKDKQQLENSVKEWSARAATAKKPLLPSIYDQNADFLQYIEHRRAHPPAPTGFKRLDKYLDGGLISGLYTIGAVSSLGKTTFVMQIAGNIAGCGRDVLIFSLEMSKFELIARDLSRISYTTEPHQPRTPGEMLRGNANIVSLQAAYSKISPHLFVIENTNRITTAFIKDAVYSFTQSRGRAPVVIVDYLQILAPNDKALSDKQKIDDDVTTLKLLSRDFDTPVIVISSLNRQNYNAPIDYQAFKESGGIEYSCDVVIGLQYKGTGTKGFDFYTARAASPREIELVTLKNRNGAIGAPIDYKYYPAYYYFEEQNSAFSDFSV